MGFFCPNQNRHPISSAAKSFVVFNKTNSQKGKDTHYY